jgi:hypothetical protein
MKNLNIFFLYCYLMALALIEMANSQLIKLFKGQQAFSVKRS